MTTLARAERAALCDLFDRVGPDASTLCEGWAAKDLAAHLVVRERRPDTALGLVVPALSGRTDRVRAAMAERPFDQVVAQVRSGPPAWSPMGFPPVENLANLLEFFVHHEDVRRAQGDGWEPRDLPDAEVEAIWAQLRRLAPSLTRKVPVGVALERTDGAHERVVVHRGDPVVTLRGAAPELALYVYGRTEQARVDADGTPAAVASLAASGLGA